MVVLASGHRVETPHYDKVTIHDRLEKIHHPPVEHDNTNTSDGSAGSTTIGTDDDGEKTWDVNSTFQHSDENKSPTEKASNSELFMWIKERTRFIHLFSDGGLENNTYSQMFVYTLAVTIFIGFISSFMETVPAYKYKPETCKDPVCNNDPILCPGAMVCEPRPPRTFEEVDAAVIYIFTIEYFLKFLTCWAVSPRDLEIVPGDYEGSLPDPEYGFIEHNLRYVFRFYNLVDLVTIVPFYSALIIGHSSKGTTFLRAIRLLRVVRLLRLLKVLKRYKVVLQMFDVIIHTLVKSFVALMVVMLLVLLVMVFFGCIIFSVESGVFTVTEDYPEGQYLRPPINQYGLEISPFVSIPTSFYWVLTTMTTVGYGDLVPTSWIGRMIGCVAMFTGLIALALPIGVIGANFAEMYQEFITNTWSSIGKAFRVDDMDEEAMQELFDQFDADSSGRISDVELRDALKRMNFELTDSDFHSLLAQIDPNKDKEITFDEFVNMIYFIQGKTRPVTVKDGAATSNLLVSSEETQRLRDVIKRSGSSTSLPTVDPATGAAPTRPPGLLSIPPSDMGKATPKVAEASTSEFQGAPLAGVVGEGEGEPRRRQELAVVSRDDSLVGNMSSLFPWGFVQDPTSALTGAGNFFDFDYKDITESKRAAMGQRGGVVADRGNGRDMQRGCYSMAAGVERSAIGLHSPAELQGLRLQRVDTLKSKVTKIRHELDLKVSEVRKELDTKVWAVRTDLDDVWRELEELAFLD